MLIRIGQKHADPADPDPKPWSILVTYQRTKQTLQIPFVLSSDSQISFRSAGLWFYNSFPYKIQSDMTLH